MSTEVDWSLFAGAIDAELTRAWLRTGLTFVAFVLWVVVVTRLTQPSERLEAATPAGPLMDPTELTRPS